MKKTPEQESALDSVRAAIQAAFLTWPREEGSDPADYIVTDWIVTTVVEKISSKSLDEEGDELDEYFTISSPGLSSHSAIGLNMHSIRRLQS